MKKLIGAVFAAGLVLSPAAVAVASEIRYPAEGGTWEYGAWSGYARSYYTVNRCHGSTVRVDDRTSKSIDTASGKTSIAEEWDYPFADRQFWYRVC